MLKQNAAHSRDAIKEKVINMIAENAEIDKDSITEESVFNVDIVLDSLDFAEMLMECEEAFDVEIPIEDATNFKKVKDLIDYLVEKNT